MVTLIRNSSAVEVVEQLLSKAACHKIDCKQGMFMSSTDNVLKIGGSSGDVCSFGFPSLYKDGQSNSQEFHYSFS